MSGELEPVRVVAIGAKLYPVEAWQAALHEVLLAELAAKMPQNSTPREAMRAVRGMKDPAVFRKVLKAALSRVEGAVPPYTDIAAASVVARFPRPE